MLAAFGGQVGAILDERADSPAPPGTDPLAVRERDLLRQVTQYRKDHGLTAGTQGGRLARQVAELEERVAALVSNAMSSTLAELIPLIRE